MSDDPKKGEPAEPAPRRDVPLWPHTYPRDLAHAPPPTGPGLPPLPRPRDGGAIRFRASDRAGTAWVSIRPDGPTNHASVQVKWDDGTSVTRDVFDVKSPEQALRAAFSKSVIEIGE